PCSLTAAAGRIVLVQSGGYGKLYLLRMRNDGTTGGDPLVGALLDSRFGPSRRQMHLALSPDGKWIYVTRISRGGDIGDAYRDGWPRYWHTVFRIQWEKGAESEAVLAGNPFVGEVGRDAKAGTGEGDDDRRLNKPKGIACDVQGRLYVCDTGNNRVQVYATDGAEGKVIRSIKVGDPQEIAVHHATGEIYVLSFKCGDGGFVNPGTELVIMRFGSVDSPALKQTYKLTAGRAHGGERGNEFMPLMCLDSWTDPPKLWLQTRRGVIQIFADRGDRLELLNDFEKDIVASGIRPYMQGDGRHNTLAVDPVRGHLYYRMASARIDDTDGPGKLTHLKFPCGWQEMECGLDGYLYVRNLTFLARFDPGKAVVCENAIEFPFEAEVPFDYGEEQKLPWQARPLRGVIKIEALPGANGFDNGIGVAPNGDVAAFMKNYRTAEAGILDNLVKEGGYIDGNELAALKKQIANMFFRPKIFPGRFANAAELIMRWNKGGEMTGEDLVPAMPNPSCGVRLDRHGNIYVGIGANMIMEDGKPHSGGTVAKFPHWGGKVYGMGDLAKLKERPDRAPEMRSYGWGDLWTKNCYWLYPGFDSMHIVGGGNYSCLCASCRFDIDLYGRCFVPKAYQFTTGVVDTNGNRICEVGRYGNADDGRDGGKSPLGIALGYCAYVAVHSDRWLYLCDDGNNRILRVKLGYKAEERAGLR
ncbi:MAG: hypothetical protein N3A38_15060, partial [Planctomycetota bacterium]|nr:hypothetical protein [Planctomycetota bacterium]